MSKFQFTSEQLDNLKLWKDNLNTQEAKAWFENEAKAALQTSSTLNNGKFIKGEDLTPEDLDELFIQMKWFSANRNLSNLLYRNNGLKEFNGSLRNLIHSSSPFYERVNNFFKLKSIGVQTLSQFLVAANDKEYPFITSQTKDVISISSEQDQSALLDALEYFSIKDKNKLLDRTLDYLRDYIIFKSIKDILNLEKYTQVNNLLWFSSEQEGQGPEETIKAYGSISIENDLRDYLADNLSAIEKGLKLVKKEFTAGDAGEIDLLCKDSKGHSVVIELKKGRTPDKVVGQTLRYLGYVQKNIDSKARGIIIVNEPDAKLDYALIPVRNLIKLKFYKVSFKIEDKFS